jgi:Holliday junction resolvasome RuvABC endonuclease subunit
MFARIIATFSELSSVLPEWVAVEPTYGGLNPQTDKKLNRLAGAIIGWCDQNDIPVYTCDAVSEIDAACGVQVGLERNRRKSAVSSMMGHLIGAGFDEDIYDAALVGLWALGERKKEEWDK